MKVTAIAAYPMNACKFTQSELVELDKVLTQELRRNKLLARQSSDEGL